MQWAKLPKPPVRFSSKTKDKMWEIQGDNKEAGVLISTYNMITYSGTRGQENS